MNLVANLSLMFTEVPMLERFAAARRAGFQRVEIQFPYEYDLEELAAASDDAATKMVLINLPPGDLAGGEAGLTALPGREREFRAGVDRALAVATRLGVKKINALAGKPRGAPRETVARTVRDNLAYAAGRFAEIDAIVLVEPVNPSDVPGFYLTELQPAMDLVASLDGTGVKLLFDLYHMEQTEPSLVDAIERCAPMIGHVQFADTPGRHEPGTGRIDFAAALAALAAAGYGGDLSAEYRATGDTTDSLAWMEAFRPWAT